MKKVIDLFERDDIQFPRLLAEIAMTQDNIDFKALEDSMNLDKEQIKEIFNRALIEFESIKRTVIH